MLQGKRRWLTSIVGCQCQKYCVEIVRQSNKKRSCLALLDNPISDRNGIANYANQDTFRNPHTYNRRWSLDDERVNTMDGTLLWNEFFRCRVVRFVKFLLYIHTHVNSLALVSGSPVDSSKKYQSPYFHPLLYPTCVHLECTIAEVRRRREVARRVFSRHGMKQSLSLFSQKPEVVYLEWQERKERFVYDLK